MEQWLKKAVSGARGYLVRKPVSSALFVIGVLYATVFMEYVPEVYFDYFEDERLRMVLVTLVALATYVNPRVGVVLLVCLLRTINYTRKVENFDMAAVTRLVNRVAAPAWFENAEQTERFEDSPVSNNRCCEAELEESIDLDGEDDSDEIDLEDDELDLM